jgi:hypothetical protein
MYKSLKVNVMSVKLDLTRPLFSLTIAEYFDLIQRNDEPTPTPSIASDEKPSEIRGIHGLAAFLGVSPVTAQKIKNSGKIPYSQFGRVVLFDGSKVLEAMAGNKKNRRA